MSAVGDARKRLAEQSAPHADPTAAAVRAAQAEVRLTEAEREAIGERICWNCHDRNVWAAVERILTNRLATDTAAPEGDDEPDRDLTEDDFVIVRPGSTDLPAAPVAVVGVETVEWGVRLANGHIAEVFIEPEVAADYAAHGTPVYRRTVTTYPDRVSGWSPVEPETSEPEGGGSRG